MFYKKHGLVPCLVQFHQEPNHILFLFKRHPCKGFIKHQKLWFQRQSTAQLNTLSHAVR